MLRWGLKTLLLVLAVGLALGGIVLGGRLALDSLREEERYTLPLAAVECDPPPGLSRADFLDEVEYYGTLPRRLHLLDEGLPARLAEGFAKHPWVAKVEKVEVLPPSEVRVQLAYRVPALVVKSEAGTRVVDGGGVLLPRSAPCEGLPVFDGKASRPAGPAGTRWGDPAVEAAARKARPVRGT
jgi:hypothetical protein